ncbi:DUF5687 family protein [Limibacterium fermenti]|mgnify:FL=1|uniref:DUF5687 family protein n=1 Tax=Limibacterium fermenti TaxID=3229863 RepID=UPI000E8C946E|nr:hypothetical protein [Porphyromonadaceae bacterium]
MITFELFKHQWLKTYRAPGFHRNLVVNILLAISGLYFAAMLVLMGFIAPSILHDALPDYQPVEAFNGLLLYIVLIIFALRFLMQPLNALDPTPYQILPIKRTRLINYLLLRPLFNPVNYAALLFMIPFAGNIAWKAPYHSGWAALRLLVITVLFVWFNILTASLLKRRYGSNPWAMAVIMLVAGILFLSEYFHVFSLFDISLRIFDFLIGNPFGWLIVAGLAGLSFVLNKRFFSQHQYAEKASKQASGGKSYLKKFSFTDRFGKEGSFISLILKLITRNKRTKSTLFVSILFLLYGLFFYPKKMYDDNYGFTFFIAMIATGSLMLMFGQWLISWNGSHFDCLMTKKMNADTYIRANYTLMMLFNILCFIVTTPYFFFGTKVIFLQVSAFLYNIGVNIFLLLYFASYNTKRLNLNEGSAMNYQGTTYKNFLIVLPVMIGPMAIIGIVSIFGAEQVAIWVFAALGVIGVIFSKPLLTLCQRRFIQRKYALCEGFRKKE